jgi:hypothetical protein
MQSIKNMLEGEWHLRITKRVRDSLEKKGLLAGLETSKRIYKELFPKAIAFYGLETFQGMHPAITAIDPEKGKPLICLSPYFGEYSPETQMIILVEEAIHVIQLRHLQNRNPTSQQYLEGELEAENRLLRIKEYLRLSSLGVSILENRKANHEAQLGSQK